MSLKKVTFSSLSVGYKIVFLIYYTICLGVVLGTFAALCFAGNTLIL